MYTFLTLNSAWLTIYCERCPGDGGGGVSVRVLLDRVFWISVVLYSSCAIIQRNDPFIQWREERGTPAQNVNIRVQTLNRCLSDWFDIWANFDAFGRNQQHSIFAFSKTHNTSDGGYNRNCNTVDLSIDCIQQDEVSQGELECPLLV